MLLHSYIAGVVLLSILPQIFLIARIAAKRLKHLSWTIDDTLLVLALVGLPFSIHTDTALTLVSAVPPTPCYSSLCCL